MNNRNLEISTQSNRPKPTKKSRLLINVLLLINWLIFVACGGNFNPLSGDPLKVTFTPSSLIMAPGETKSVDVKVRLTSNGNPGIFPIRANIPGLSVTPESFMADLSVATEVTQTLQITASSETGTYTLSVGDASSVYKTLPVTVANTEPDFMISAAPTLVSVPPNSMSENVNFTVTSINGFSGPVKVSWSTEGQVTPSPDNNDVTASISPSNPYTFTRKMYRFATHNLDIPVIFKVEDIPFTKQRSVTITVRQQ